MNLTMVLNKNKIPLIISLMLSFIEFFSFQPDLSILLILFLVQYIALTTIIEFSDVLKIVESNFRKVLFVDREELPSLSRRVENEKEETHVVKSNMLSKYEVYVDDNFHYMDESERYKLGEYETCEEAVSACKKIVDDFLETGYTKGMSFKELYEGYIGFGEDPFIISNDKKCFFSAWDYAKERCRDLCGKEK